MFYSRPGQLVQCSHSTHIKTTTKQLPTSPAVHLSQKKLIKIWISFFTSNEQINLNQSYGISDTENDTDVKEEKDIRRFQIFGSFLPSLNTVKTHTNKLISHELR